MSEPTRKPLTGTCDPEQSLPLNSSTLALHIPLSHHLNGMVTILKPSVRLSRKGCQGRREINEGKKFVLFAFEVEPRGGFSFSFLMGKSHF